MQLQGSFNMEHIHLLQFIEINVQSTNSQSVKTIKIQINSSNITGHLLIFKENERKYLRYQVNQNNITSEM